ncbi:hypothetical protein D6853_14525 [Butyrivibrio sp. X503]|nr:hypothetical protein D6853_14525 [Butyrivibrio sp. X503]SFU94664.1 hypothetical protein SAMN02910342_02545 [Butyrivibrio sp. INlla21]
MANNVKRICINCGRTFTAREGRKVFCSFNCKRLYGNHISFRCRDCRNATCSIRNNNLVNAPYGCENLLNPNR